VIQLGVTFGEARWSRDPCREARPASKGGIASMVDRGPDRGVAFDRMTRKFGGVALGRGPNKRQRRALGFTKGVTPRALFRGGVTRRGLYAITEEFRRARFGEGRLKILEWTCRIRGVNHYELSLGKVVATGWS